MKKQVSPVVTVIVILVVVVVVALLWNHFGKPQGGGSPGAAGQMSSVDSSKVDMKAALKETEAARAAARKAGEAAMRTRREED